MLDKTVPYADFYMKRPAGLAVPVPELPKGYRFVFYQAGDQEAWCRIETSVLEFKTKDDAASYFEKTFLPEEKELIQRMFFVEDPQGQKVATCTAWWEQVKDEKLPLVHWVAVMPEAQRKGIARAMMCKVTQLLQEFSQDKPIHLHTQTWSHPAVDLYQQLGYQIIAEQIDGSKNHDYQKAIDILAAIY